MIIIEYFDRWRWWLDDQNLEGQLTFDGVEVGN